MEQPDDENVVPAGEVQLQRLQQRSSISSFVFIIFMLFMLANNNSDEYLAKGHYQDALNAMNDRLSNYTAWINGEISNFTMLETQPALTPLVQSFVPPGNRLDPLYASYFPNTTGFIRGNVDFYNITPASLEQTTMPWKSHAQSFMSATNMTELHEKLGIWNWSAASNLSWSVVDHAPVAVEGVSERIAMIHGRIDFSYPASADEIQLEFDGIHYLSNGSLYGFAEPSGRRTDIRYLPTIVPKSVQNDTARVIVPELLSRIKKTKEMIDSGIVDQGSSDATEPQSTCGFLVYAQIEPSTIPQDLMLDLEDELQKPTGRWTVNRPPLRLNGMLVSRECGLLYRLHDATGLRSQSFFRKVTNYASSASLVHLVMLGLLSRQIDRTHSPAGLVRLSAWTFLSQAILDAVVFAGHITFAILANGRPSMSLVAPAFLACLLFALEAQHAMLIGQVQAPEDAAARPPPPPRPPTPAQTGTTTSPPAGAAPQPALPLPTTAPPRLTGTSFFWLLVHQIRSDPQARIWFGMFIFFTFFFRMVVTPTLALLFIAVMYLSFWLPPIIRSVKRGRSSAMSAEYVIGMTICRLYFLFYFLTCPKNVLDIEPRRWAYHLSAVVILQAGVILLQQRLGPAFFLPKRFANADTYDYHPPLPLSLSTSDPESPNQSLGDCSICMEAIHADEGKQQQLQHVAGGLLQKVGGRKNYSLAPCHHLFHTECLEKWLAIKNICPQCRRPLPPL